jgi:hypothetical protein
VIPISTQGCKGIQRKGAKENESRKEMQNEQRFSLRLGPQLCAFALDYFFQT